MFSSPYNNHPYFFKKPKKIQEKPKKRPKYKIKLSQNSSQNGLIILRNGLTIS